MERSGASAHGWRRTPRTADTYGDGRNDIVARIAGDIAAGLTVRQIADKRHLPVDFVDMAVERADKRGLLAAYYLELTTGLRRGELLALLWTDLDIENKTISVTKQVNRIKGQLVVNQPKTQNSIRTLAIPQQAVDLQVEEHRKHPSNPFMFPSPATGEMYYPDSVVNLHKKILKDAGLEHIRFHDLRHTFATMALQNGVDIKTLSSMLGHYDAGFTLRTYTHATRQKQDEAAETMGSFMEQVM